MSKALDQLNLRPQEKRVIVIVLFLVFAVLNYWFVLPLFGQLKVVKANLAKSQTQLNRFKAEIERTPGYEKTEAQLKKEGGEVLSEELQLNRIIDTQARSSGVNVSRYQPGVRTASGRTNQFFEDQGLTIDFTTGGKELVDFLVGLANGNSMIHVQDMNLRPDGPGTKLMGNIMFVASYQKTQVAPPKVGGAPAKPASTKTNTPAAKSVAKTNAPASKPAAKPNSAAPKTATNTVKSPKK